MDLRLWTSGLELAKRAQPPWRSYMLPAGQLSERALYDAVLLRVSYVSLGQ